MPKHNIYNTQLFHTISIVKDKRELSHICEETSYILHVLVLTRTNIDTISTKVNS